MNSDEAAKAWRPGDHYIELRPTRTIKAGMYAEPGEYLKMRDGRGWWYIEEDGSYRRVKGALVVALDEQWEKEHPEDKK